MRKILLSLFGLLSLALPVQALAYEVPQTWREGVCQFIPCSAFGGGAGGLSDYIVARAIPAMEVAFVAIALIILFLAGVNMVIFAEQDDVVKQSRSSFVYAIAGGGVVAFARWLAHAFTPLETGSNLVNSGIVSDAIGNVLTFFKLLLALLLTVNIVVQAFRILTSQGEDDQIGKARKRLIAGFIGIGFVMLANTVAIAVNPNLGNSNQMAVEIAGIANYLITIIGMGAVIVIIVAGVMLMTTIDESVKDKAKNAVRTAVIALVAVLVAYALVTTFIAV